MKKTMKPILQKKKKAKRNQRQVMRLKNKISKKQKYELVTRPI